MSVPLYTNTSAGEGDLSRGQVRSVCVVVWRDAVTPPRFALQREALDSCVMKFGSQSAFLCVVEPLTPLPNEAMRRASAELIASHAGTLRCVACVIEGTGFAAAAVRSVFSAMYLLVSAFANDRHAVPISFFATVAEAASWVSRYIDIGPYEPFRAAVEVVRARRG